MKGRDGLHPAALSFLAAIGDRVGWYPLHGPEYFEFSLDGRIIGKYPTIEHQGAMGFALCESGAAYVSRQVRGKSGPERFEVFSLDRESRTWKPVGNTPKSNWGYLYGCEADKLVTWNRSEGAGVKVLDFWKPE